MMAMKFTIDGNGMITPPSAAEFFAAVPIGKFEILPEVVDMADSTIVSHIYQCGGCEKFIEHPVGHTKTYDCEC